MAFRNGTMIGALNSDVKGISRLTSDVAPAKMSLRFDRSIIFVLVFRFWAIFCAASVSLTAICPYLKVMG